MARTGWTAAREVPLPCRLALENSATAPSGRSAAMTGFLRGPDGSVARPRSKPRTCPRLRVPAIRVGLSREGPHRRDQAGSSIPARGPDIRFATVETLPRCRTSGGAPQGGSVPKRRAPVRRVPGRTGTGDRSVSASGVRGVRQRQPVATGAEGALRRSDPPGQDPARRHHDRGGTEFPFRRME